MTLEIESINLDNTLNIAASVGRQIKGGEVIELKSDLGGGKTTFVRGLVQGMGSEDHVASPTFTISRQYRASKLELHHYDFYRLHNPGVIQAELAESIAEPNVAVVIEWAGVVQDVLPEDRLTIEIRLVGGTARMFYFSAGVSHKHLLKGARS